MEEIWKDIEGYNGHYQVSNLGRVKSIGGKTWKGERIKKQEIDVGGYLRVSFGRKHFKVHRLVAKAFLQNPENLPCINHKDEVKTNNCVWNLEWCDNKYNSNYGTAIKRWSEKQYKKVLCIETGVIYKSVKECKKAGYLHCDAVCRGERNKCKGLHFTFV